MNDAKTPMALIYDARVRALVFQVILILTLVLGAWWLVGNTVSNLSDQGKTLGFNFLVQTAGFQISSTLGLGLWTIMLVNHLPRCLFHWYNKHFCGGCAWNTCRYGIGIWDWDYAFIQ